MAQKQVAAVHRHQQGNDCVSPAVPTCSSGQRLQGHGVWDAPEGQSARRVSLDEQFVEGFPSAEEELSHGRTDQELEDDWGGGDKKEILTL